MDEKENWSDDPGVRADLKDNWRYSWGVGQRGEPVIFGTRSQLTEAEVVYLLSSYEAELEMYDEAHPRGKEAEELRSGIEKLVKEGDGDTVDVSALQRLLDTVDARDSLSYLRTCLPKNDDHENDQGEK